MRSARTILLGAALLGAVAGSPAAQGPGAVPTDNRERLLAPAPARTKILFEMRGMLEALEGVLDALARGDRVAAAEAARHAGVAHAVDAAPQMQRVLPAAFVEAGLETHRAFDALATFLERPGDERGALAELAALTGRCVACHAVWRLDEAR